MSRTGRVEEGQGEIEKTGRNTLKQLSTYDCSAVQSPDRYTLMPVEHWGVNKHKYLDMMGKYIHTHLCGWGFVYIYLFVHINIVCHYFAVFVYILFLLVPFSFPLTCV